MFLKDYPNLTYEEIYSNAQRGEVEGFIRGCQYDDCDLDRSTPARSTVPETELSVLLKTIAAKHTVIVFSTARKSRLIGGLRTKS